MLECKKCGNREYTTKKNGPHIGAYCSRCGKWIKWIKANEPLYTTPVTKERPTRCIDPVIKYCQGCKWGWVKYPDWVETREGLDGVSFESGCTLSLEDTVPTPEEEAEFDSWRRKLELDRQIEAENALDDDDNCPF